MASKDFVIGSDSRDVQQYGNVRGLPRQVANTEALLQRKLAEYNAALAERERLLSRLRVMEAVLPPVERAVQRLSLHASQKGSALTAPDAPARAPAPVPAASGPTDVLELSSAASSNGPNLSPATATEASATGEAPGADGFDEDFLLDALNAGALGDASLLDDFDPLSLLLLLPATPDADHDALLHQDSSSSAEAGPHQQRQQAAVAAAATTAAAGPSALAMTSSDSAPAAAGACADAGSGDAPRPAGQLPAASPEEASALLAGKWREYVQTASFLLARAHVRPEEEDAAEEALRCHWFKLLDSVGDVSLAYPNAWFSLYGLNLETGVREEPPPGQWRAVARAACLSPDQVAEVREMLALYDERMKAVVGERRDLTAQLSEALEASAASQDAAAQAHALSERLAQNAARQRMALTTALMFVSYSPSFKHTLNARVSLAAWPFVPDTLACLREMVAMADAQQADLRT